MAPSLPGCSPGGARHRRAGSKPLTRLPSWHHALPPTGGHRDSACSREGPAEPGPGDWAPGWAVPCPVAERRGSRRRASSARMHSGQTQWPAAALRAKSEAQPGRSGRHRSRAASGPGAAAPPGSESSPGPHGEVTLRGGQPLHKGAPKSPTCFLNSLRAGCLSGQAEAQVTGAPRPRGGRGTQSFD